MTASRAGNSALLILCVSQFVLQLDFSIVNVALETIEDDLGFSATGLQWVVTGYALTYGSLLMLGGRLGDVLGRRRLLVGGLWLFGVASVACGLAVSPAMLVGARFVQGIGAAMMAPTILALLTAVSADGAERARALALWTAATAAGGTTGVVASGVLTQLLGWRSIFLVNIPVIAVLIVAARRVLPELDGDRGRSLNVVGATLVTAAIAALIFGLSTGEHHGFGSAQALGGFAVALACGVAFAISERHADEPMLPLSFLAVPVRRVSVVVMLVWSGAFTAYAYFIALYLQGVLDFGEVTTSLAMLPAPATFVLTSTLLTRRLIDRFGLKPVMIAGLATTAAGQLLFAQISDDTSYVTGVVPGLLLTAVGGGLTLPAVSIGMMSRVGPQERGLAGGVLPTAQQLGAAIGLAALATIAASTSGDGGSLVSGYRASYLVGACILAVAAVVVIFSDMRVASPAPAAGPPGEPASKISLK